jgi:ABC-2 type transport system permease protein
MRHTVTIASRELRSLFVSPVAYVVLTLWSVIAGTFFLASLIGFQERLIQLQQYQMIQQLEQLNLNDELIEPFIGSMWVILLFLLPAVTMGLVSSEKANGTDELLMTSPISIWDIVFGKFLAGAGFVSVMTAIVAFFPALLFYYGEPELGRTVSGVLCLLLVSMTYVAVGVFASSVTRNQLIAFMLTLVLLVMLGMMLPFIVQITTAGSGLGPDSGVVKVVGWMATGSHVDRMLQGLIDTGDLAYFAIATSAFLLLSKTAIESARWR